MLAPDTRDELVASEDRFAAAAASARGRQTMLVAANALAGTAIDVLTDARLRRGGTRPTTSTGLTA